MQIRLATKEDVPTLVEMWGEAFEDQVQDMPVVYPELGHEKLIGHSLAQMIDAPLAFVGLAEADGHAAAMLTAQIGFRATTYPPAVLDVNLLYVREKYRETTRASSHLVRALRIWLKSVTMRHNADIAFAELTTRANERIIKHWSDKGWRVHGVMMHTEIGELA